MSTRLWRRRRDDDFRREIEAHLALETRALIDDGVAPDHANAMARRTFGNVTAARERFYERGRILWLDHLAHDLRDALRNIARYPVACIVAVTSLAGGIGATTATLTIRDVVFHRPPPLYADPEHLSRIEVTRPARPMQSSGADVPGPLYALWSSAGTPLRFAAAGPTGMHEVRVGNHTETLRVRCVTRDFFRVLGVAPAVGRTFEPAAAPSATPVVLSDRIWQRLFDARADTPGQTIWIDGRPFEIVGVMPRRFWFSTTESVVWVPLEQTDLAGEAALEVVARRPTLTSRDALQQLQAGLHQYAASLPSSERQLNVRVSGIEGTPIGRNVSLVLPWLLGASVLLTLLIACANVAILVIAQWTAREHEIAIRASLGASRARIVRALVAESVLIAVVGGALGVAATFVLRGLIVFRAGSAVEWFDLSVAPRILVEACAITLLAGVLAGIGPALFETRRVLGNPLRAIAMPERTTQRWRHTLVVFEISVTVALLVVTATLLDSYRRMLTTELGFSPHPLITIRVDNRTGVPVGRVLDAIRAVPGVVSAAVSTSVPYAASAPVQRVSATPTDPSGVRAEIATISGDFFSTLGVSIREGRSFTTSDLPRAHTAIVNETLARRLAGNRPAVGERVWVGNETYEIVGVVADYINNAFEPHERAARLFRPLAPAADLPGRIQFLVRAPADPAGIARAVRRTVAAAGSGNVVMNVYTIDEVIAVGGQEILVGTAPLLPLIATGMLLTAAGIYGVLAFAIARRSKELALRVALGAAARDVVRLVCGHGLRLVAMGIVIGIGMTFALSRVVRASGGAGSAFDPAAAAFVVPALVVAAIAAAATIVPTRRAVRINPAVLLRDS